MVTFKTFLENEELRSTPHTDEIEVEEAIDWLTKNCPNVIRNMANPQARMYRGMWTKHPYDKVLIGDSRAFRRKSANTKNYYTSFISSSDNWQNFPNRENSFICGTSENLAEGYGRVYLCLPSDDALIGITSAWDFWGAFSRVGASGINSLYALNEFLDALSDFFQDLDFPDDDPYALRHTLRMITQQKLKVLIDSSAVNSVGVVANANTILNKMKTNKLNNLEQWLDWAMDPIPNGISVTKGAQYKGAPGAHNKGNEVWIQGKVLFVPEHSVSDKSELSGFLNSYGWSV